MNKEEFKILTDDKIQSLIEANLNEDPAKFALNHRKKELSTLLVSSQLKYLQKSQKKIPTFYKARCIIPPIAFEQASSEQSAKMKSFEGLHCLDLSCGLGVDTAHFSRNFKKVDAVEIDSLKVEIARYNFRKMRISNVNFVHSSAKKYLDSFSGPPYDLIYLDPARRDKTGKRTYAPEDCEPNIFELLPALFKHGKQILVKLSPLYDIAEAVRQFPQLGTFHIYSVDNECKEVLLQLAPGTRKDQATEILLKSNRAGQLYRYSFDTHVASPTHKVETEFSYVWDADVAFFKGRVQEKLYTAHFADTVGFLSHPQGFFFSPTPPPDKFPGRSFKVLEKYPYKPKMLKKSFKTIGLKRAEIIRRDFPFAIKDIRKQLQLSAGGNTYLLACMLEGKKTLLRCERNS